MLAWSTLVAQAQQGDIAAFEQLVGAHYEALYAFGTALCNDPVEGADIAQEALIKAFRKIKTYRYAAPFKTWLLQIARNTFLDRVRHQRQLQAKVERYARVETQASPPDPESQLLEQQQSAQIHAALEAVPMPFREVVILFDLHGHSYQEIAEVCSVPMGTVKSRLRRGRDALRRALADQGVIGSRNHATPRR